MHEEGKDKLTDILRGKEIERVDEDWFDQGVRILFTDGTSVSFQAEGYEGTHFIVHYTKTFEKRL